VYNYLACFDIVVISSLWEGCPVSALEAMGMGKPVVATKVGDLPEIIENGVSGLLVPPADAGELARCILLLLGDPDLARRIGHAAHEQARNRYGLEQMANSYVELYEQVGKSRE
jgi:glycosyltransferase involved in cell wall biosynthesis